MTEDEEMIGRDIFEQAGFTPADPPVGGAITLAVEIYGGDCIIESPRAQTEGEIARYKDREWIVLAPRLPTKRAHFAVARMLARLAIRAAGVVADERAVAAFLVAPPPAFRAKLFAIGLDLPRLADSFAVTETCAAIRVAEVGGDDGLVITPERVYRPSAGLAWVDDGAARGLASRASRSLRKVAIRDEPGRVALYRRAG